MKPLTLLVTGLLLLDPSAGAKSSKSTNTSKSPQSSKIMKTSKSSHISRDSPFTHAKSKKNAQISKERLSKTSKKTSNETAKKTSEKKAKKTSSTLSSAPSDSPSSAPTVSESPSSAPSDSPSSTPSSAPSENPSSAPSDAPSAAPSEVPSEAPSELPSVAPSEDPCSAETFSTDDIVAGIDCTVPGGTLKLTAGTYTERTLIIQKEISIECTEADQVCILDGENDHVVVSVGGTAVSLTGLKITKGRTPNGAGVYIHSSSVTMTDCIISDNNAEFYGGGVYVQSSGSATLMNCVLEGNRAGEGYGGGMYVIGTATLYGCTFASNTASISSSGPDIYNYGTVTVYGDGEGYSDCEVGDELSTGSSDPAVSGSGGPVTGAPYSWSGCTAVLT